ncbi:MAG: HlyD family efflux transporter periplasmic adaptor subunit [Saprospiraceae bacterium]|nr:HlyD family efflux transporter periplasmic adaptor subunit [Saprospiraceae bacterium]
MEVREYIELRSEEVQEILGTPPSWLVRWGSLVIFFCLAVMLAVSALVRYPDVVSGRIEITTAVPPVDVVAQADGYLERVFVKDQAEVTAQAVVGLLESTAHYEDVRTLESLLSVWSRTDPDSLAAVNPPANLMLGDLQAEYAALLRQFEQLRLGVRSQQTNVSRNESANASRIDRLRQSINNERRSAERLEDQLKTARELYLNQKKLYNEGIVSRMELEKERTKVTLLERELEQTEGAIFQKENEIITLQKSTGDVRSSALEEQAGSRSTLNSSINALRGSIARWKKSYLLTAPVGGQVSLNSSFFGQRQFVKTGDVVLTIVPPGTDTLFGRMALPIGGSGRVQPKQRVIIKLDNYPYSEFGTVEGTVFAKSLVPRDNAYRIQVLLEHGLHTSYNRDLPFQQQLQGQAEIVTEEKSFLRRITDQVFAGRKGNALGKN